MFEGLDEIDWENLGISHYGENKKIPQNIRNLLSFDKDVRDQSRASLLGWGQDYGDVYDTTSYIIPFIVEILSNPDALGKEDLLDHLSATIENVKNAVNISMPMMRRYVKTFDSFKAGLDVLISLLYDDASSIRLGVVHLLQYWPDEQEIVLHEFEKRFGFEKEEQLRVALLEGMKVLIGPLYSFQPAKKECEQFARMVLNTNASPAILLAASKTLAGAIYPHRFDVIRDETALKAVNLLSMEFLKVSALAEYHQWSKEFDEALMIIKDLVNFGFDYLLEIFQNSQISPLQSHLVGMGLLATAYVPTYMGDEFWRGPRLWSENATGIFYAQKHSGLIDHIQFAIKKENRSDQALNILQAIYDNQSAWEIPTNMFSFFFGLPDSRDELHNLLQQV